MKKLLNKWYFRFGLFIVTYLIYVIYRYNTYDTFDITNNGHVINVGVDTPEEIEMLKHTLFTQGVRNIGYYFLVGWIGIESLISISCKRKTQRIFSS